MEQDGRRLRVIKMRGTKFRGGYHDFTIQTGGIAIYPRLDSLPSTIRHSSARRTQSGSAELDALLEVACREGQARCSLEEQEWANHL